jgi:hypothetical protein
MKVVPLLFLACVLSACAHQAKKVDCDKHLQAINPPTPVLKSTAPSKVVSP